MKANAKASIFTNIFMLAGLTVVWILFAPSKIGGQTSYVIINGNSMEPGFHRGDLVLVKTAPEYREGDIVAYKDAKMGAYVFHRIIAIKQERFILQGDNNSWKDDYQPTHNEIVGKLWLRVPKMGVTVEWLRAPLHLALATAGLGGVLMTSSNLQSNSLRKRKNKTPANLLLGWFETTVYLLGFAALAFLALTVFSFRQPATRAAEDVKYEQTGVFYYSAASPAGIYDTEILRSGDPIFQKLTCGINIGYSYNITGPLERISGSQKLEARISDEQSGWQRTLTLKEETTFNGSSYSVIAPVDLCQAQELVSAVEAETGFRPNTYTLTIISQTAVAAKVNDQDLYDSFTSNLVFQFDKVHFYLADKNGETDPLQSSQSGRFTSSETQINTVKFLGLNASVPGLRAVGLGGLALSLLCLLSLGAYVFTAAQRDPQTLLQIKYGSIVMDVYDYDFGGAGMLIQTASVDDLAKLAERQNTMILRLPRNGSLIYFVRSDGVTYYYNSGEGKPL
jgi:signal peptidase I